MKSKTTPVTLQAIGKLIDRKFDQRLFPINKELGNLNTKIIGIYGELDEIKGEIRGHRQETKDGFDAVFDGLTSLGTALDLDHEKRIKRLETKVFAN